MDTQIDCLDIVGFEQLLLGDAPSCLHADANFDGVVDALDIQPYLDLLFSPECQNTRFRCVLDVNGDLLWTEEDITAFADLLLAI